LKLTRVDSRARVSISHLVPQWIKFGSSRLENEDQRENFDLGLFSFYLNLV